MGQRQVARGRIRAGNNKLSIYLGKVKLGYNEQLGTGHFCSL